MDSFGDCSLSLCWGRAVLSHDIFGSYLPNSVSSFIFYRISVDFILFVFIKINLCVFAAETYISM